MNPYLIGAKLALSDYGKLKPIHINSGIVSAMRYNRVSAKVAFYWCYNLVLATRINWSGTWDAIVFYITGVAQFVVSLLYNFPSETGKRIDKHQEIAPIVDELNRQNHMILDSMVRDDKTGKFIATVHRPPRPPVTQTDYMVWT